MAVRIGSCSWTEKTLIKSKEFYPKGVTTAEERLKYYSSVFDVVEVDSSYYAIPSEHTAGFWAERTPYNFIFHLKAYGPLTGHSTDLRSMPSELRDMLPSASLGEKRITIKDKETRAASFRLFREALTPLKSADKLGIIVFQYPPFFLYSKQNLDYILFCKEMMADLKIGVEFRHGSWLTENRRKEIFEFLRQNGLTYIAADEPQYGSLATVPFVPEATSDTAYIRLHGRNRENWLKRGIDTSERYNYLYSENELQSFIEPIRTLKRKTKTTHVMFNNCHGGFAMRNALAMRQLLTEENS